jgi:hypothetical protein
MVIKPKTLRWVEHLIKMGEMRKRYVLGENLNGGGQSEDLGVDGKIILKFVVKR